MPLFSRRMRFSVAGLLLLTTAACIAAALWAATRPYSVTAYLQVTPNYGFPAGRSLSAMEIERAAMNALSLANSRPVINAALSRPQVHDIAVGDSDYWADRLDVSFPNDGQLMELRIDGRGWGRRVDKQVLDAVIDAYLQQVESLRQQGTTVPELIVIQQPVASP